MREQLFVRNLAFVGGLLDLGRVGRGLRHRCVIQGDAEDHNIQCDERLSPHIPTKPIAWH